jgi:hypothetical protein
MLDAYRLFKKLKCYSCRTFLAEKHGNVNKLPLEEG